MSSTSLKKPTISSINGIDAIDIESGTIEAFGYQQSYKRMLGTLGNVCLAFALNS